MIETQIFTPELFDDSPEEDDLYGFELQDDLTEEQIEDAMKLLPFSRGLMIITGAIGAGKGLWGHTIAYKMKRYFKNRTVFKDEKPRMLFGHYEPFNTMTIAAELAALMEGDELLPGEISRASAKMFKRISSLAELWMTTIGEKKLKNGVLHMTEFWRYMHNRNPFSPMGILLGAIIKRWRHMDLLIIGDAQKKKELDRFSCIPHVTFEVRASWLGNHIGAYRVRKTKSIGTNGVLTSIGKSKTWNIDGARPRELLGGKRYFDLFVSKSNY